MANPTLVFPGLSCVLAFHYSTPSNPDSCVPKHFTSGGHQGIEEGRNDGSAGWGGGGSTSCQVWDCSVLAEAGGSDPPNLNKEKKERREGRGRPPPGFTVSKPSWASVAQLASLFLWDSGKGSTSSDLGPVASP